MGFQIHPAGPTFLVVLRVPYKAGRTRGTEWHKHIPEFSLLLGCILWARVSRSNLAESARPAL